eukprot:1170120-Amphidinium_carterae.1
MCASVDDPGNTTHNFGKTITASLCPQIVASSSHCGHGGCQGGVADLRGRHLHMLSIDPPCHDSLLKQ